MSARRRPEQRGREQEGNDSGGRTADDERDFRCE